MAIWVSDLIPGLISAGLISQFVGLLLFSAVEQELQVLCLVSGIFVEQQIAGKYFGVKIIVVSKFVGIPSCLAILLECVGMTSQFVDLFDLAQW